MQKPSLLALAFLLSVSFLFSSISAYSQDSKISSGTSVADIVSSPIPDPQVSEVVRNIKIARNNGDMNARSYWENKLNELTHPQIISTAPDDFTNKLYNTTVNYREKTLNVTTITGSLMGSSSISRERVTGEIYAAVGIYGGASADTLKVFRSTDNGIHYTLINAVTSPGLKITYNSIDVEAVSKGDSTFAFLSMSYVLGGTTYNTFIYRIRQDGAQVNSLILGGTATNKYVNARITSDNARYTDQTYIYLSVVLDSVVAGARNLRSKLAVVKNPFSTAFTLTMGYQANPNGQYGYLVGGTAPDSATFETDVAYVNSGGDSDQVYTLSVVRGVPAAFGGGTWLAYSRSNNYGATAPTLFQNTADTKLKEKPRLATTGFSNNSMMTVVRRLFGGNDWDPYYFYSSLINAPIPAFTSDYVDSSTDTTFGVSVAGKSRGNGLYLFAYNNLKGFGGNKVLIRGILNGTFGFPVQANPSDISGTSAFGIPDAGFRNVAGDSCLVMWGGNIGIGAYVTGGCTGAFVGIGNNGSEITDFRLDQNYPNPFNPTTNISYNLPVSGLVKIVVYDVLGSEVATILNENKVAGYYSASFDGKNLSSGAYYYKITFTSDNNSFSQTKKMMLIK